MFQDHPVPDGAKLITQVSRWDRLKDPMGVLRCFVEELADKDAHLLLAGPSVAAVTDDPEGAEVLAEVDQWRSELDPEIRRRVHLATLPMEDIQENAAIVNAIQRRSDIVVQKSLAEGFGLTVAEAMWKARPVVASRRGGIQDQVVDGESGILLDDPLDLPALGAALRKLLDDPGEAGRMGVGARKRVEERFLGTRTLIQYRKLLSELLEHVRAGA
jgi:trehalose synthase